jgi:ABC-type transporter Mla subunit MlaD
MKLRVQYLFFILLFLSACTSENLNHQDVVNEYDLQVEAIDKVSDEIDQFTHEIVQNRTALDDAINDLELYK